MNEIYKETRSCAAKKLFAETGLPYAEPRFKTYNYLGSSGVVANNYKDIENWYFNNCIQWQCSNSVQLNDFTISSLNPKYTQPMFKKWFLYDCTDFDCLDEMIHDLIDNGYYMFFWGIDDYYVDGSINYSRCHFFHDAMIFGYDDEEQTYAYASYSNNLRYEKYYVTKASVSSAIDLAFIKGWGSSCAIKVKEDYPDTEISLDAITNGIKDYLCQPADDQYIYGIGVYDQIISYLKQIKEKSKRLDQRVFRLIMEHKKCMLDRMDALAHENLVDQCFLSEFDSVFQQSCKLHLLCIKYNMKHDQGIIDFKNQRISNQRKSGIR